MTRIVLRYLNFPAFVLLVMVGIAVQTSLFASYPFMYLQPDVVLLAVIWCSLFRGFAEGGILTLLFAEIAEAHSAAPKGLFLTTYMAVYLGMRLSARFLVIPNFSGLIITTLGASVVWKLASLGVLSMLGAASNQWKHTLVLLFPGAVMEGVAGIWVYRWLERFDWLTYKNEQAAKLLQDDLQLQGEGL